MLRKIAGWFVLFLAFEFLMCGMVYFFGGEPGSFIGNIFIIHYIFAFSFIIVFLFLVAFYLISRD